MKYIITNSNKYLRTRDDGASYIIVDSIDKASFYSLKDASFLIRSVLRGETNWGFRKISWASDDCNYVVTTGNRYVMGEESLTTANINDARIFDTLNEAEWYVRQNPYVFDNPVVIDENSEFICEFLIRKDNSRHSRIILTPMTKRTIYDRYKHQCVFCGRNLSYGQSTIDHKNPLNRGGDNGLSNLQLACDVCNKMKGDSTDDEFINGATNILTYKVNDGEVPPEALYPLIRGLVRASIHGKILT